MSRLQEILKIVRSRFPGCVTKINYTTDPIYFTFKFEEAAELLAKHVCDFDEDLFQEVMQLLNVCNSKTQTDNHFIKACGQCKKCRYVRQTFEAYGMYDVF